jgi:hypothetical protein
MYPLEPEEEDYCCLPIDWDGVYTEETFGDRLRLFYNQFNSSVRALLDDSLFREVEDNGVIKGLEILCGNEIICRRLTQKYQKIGNEIRWIWPETVTKFTIGVATPAWRGQSFELQDYWLK